jgi:rhamnosyltransferase
VAVLLAAFDGMRWLPEQMETIWAQRAVALTVFISVDSSSDGTEAWCAAQAALEPRLQLLAQGMRFGGAARNFFRLLRDVPLDDFDYVCFSDQDDLWLPDKLVRAIAQMQAAEAQAYSCNVTAFWADGRQVLVDKAQPQVRWDYLFEAAGPGCGYVLQVGLARQVQGLVRAQWQAVQSIGLHDWFIYAFARSKGFRWVIDAEPGLLYRQHERNQVGANASWLGLWRRARKILSGWGMEQAALTARLLDMQQEPFVRAGLLSGRLGLLYLLRHTRECRRRQRDRWYFSLVCLGLLLGVGAPD